MVTIRINTDYSSTCNAHILDKINKNLITERDIALISLLNLKPQLGKDLTVSIDHLYMFAVNWDAFKYQVKDARVYGWLKVSLV